MSKSVSLTHYHLPCPETLTFAVVADLHDSPAYRDLLPLLREGAPDAILIPGDLCESLSRRTYDAYENALAFLREAVGIAPVFYSLGNHDAQPNKDFLRQLHALDVTLLDDADVLFRGIRVGGLTSAYHREGGTPNFPFLIRFSQAKEYTLLLCHHPEYYPVYLKHLPIDCIVSGHAHGGQWRLFGRGVFSPNQGLFPRLTSGVHDERLVISRGALKIGCLPRFGNPPEVLMLRLSPKGNA